jgi:peptidyl-tRNA hydrolase, PTH2 family
MNTKQVIVIRKDLKMRRGKEIAQGAHAAMAWLHEAVTSGQLITIDSFNEAERAWLEGSHAKICCQVSSEEALLTISRRATDAGLRCHIILDEGRTEFGGKPTYTCLAIGPDESEKIDLITGNLELY